MYVYACMYVYISMYVCVDVYSMYAYVCVCVVCVCVHVHECVHMCAHVIFLEGEEEQTVDLTGRKQDKMSLYNYKYTE